MESRSQKIRYIIIEDEVIARRGLHRQLECYEQLQCVGIYGNVEDALMVLKKQEIDLAFVDVHLPGQSGLHFAQLMENQMKFVFITAYSQYALTSFEFDTIDYLLKPFTEAQLQRTIAKILRFFKENHKEIKTLDHIFVRADRRYYQISLNDITYIEGMRDYVIIHMLNRKLITAMNIKNFLSQLPADRFIRVSKSFVVNLARIDSLDNHSIWVAEYEISLGASYRDEVMTLIKKQAENG